MLSGGPPKNPHTERLTLLIKEHPELQRELDAISEAVRDCPLPSAQREVMACCEHVRHKYDGLLEREPALAYIVSRHYVKLLKPADDYAMEFADHAFEYWSSLYQSSLTAATLNTPGPFGVWAQFYPTLFRLFVTNLEFQNVSMSSAEDTVVAHLCKVVHEFVQHLVYLRRVTRHLLGSHWFLWTEFAMFNGIDMFMNYLEPKVVAEEHKHDQKCVTITDGGGGGDEQMNE